MAQIRFEESLQGSFAMLGKVPSILIPLFGASVLNLLFSLLVSRRWLLMNWMLFAVMAIVYLLLLVNMVWVTLLLRHHEEGKSASLRETWIELSENFGLFLPALIMVAVIVSLGFFLYLIPGIFLLALFFITIPQTAVEKTTLDRSLSFLHRFVFAEKNFLPLLLYAVILFLITLIPWIGSFIAAFLATLWFPYCYLTYGHH